MQRRWIPVATAAAALFAALPLESSADSRLLQDTRRNTWALLSERAARIDDKLESLTFLSPAGVPGPEISWLKTADLKPSGGLQLGLADGWTLRADWERYRPRAVQVRETIDTFLLALQYSFR